MSDKDVIIIRGIVRHIVADNMWLDLIGHNALRLMDRAIAPQLTPGDKIEITINIKGKGK